MDTVCPSTSAPPHPIPLTAVDHGAFPHIIERILRFADARTLLAFSRTSRAYRHCATTATQHLVLERRGRGLSLRSRRGSLGAPLPPETNHIVARAHLSHAGFAPRVLDFVGPTGANAPRGMHMSAPTVRFIQRGGISKHNFARYPSTTSIVFGALDLREDYGLAYWSGPGVPPHTRLVWSVGGVGEGRVHNKLSGKELREVVLIFSAQEGVPEVFGRWVRMLVKEVGVRLVGFEGPVGGVRGEEAQEVIRQQVGEVGRLEFVEVEEYVREVGREQYELETMEELW
jgi:hypothetical protein